MASRHPPTSLDGDRDAFFLFKTDFGGFLEGETVEEWEDNVAEIEELGEALMEGSLNTGGGDGRVKVTEETGGTGGDKEETGGEGWYVEGVGGRIMELAEKAAGALEDGATGVLVLAGWEAFREVNSAKDDNSHY